MNNLWVQFVNIDYKKHLLLSITVKLLLVAYGIQHDQFSKVKYTDVDYNVFTDAARHLYNGNSPYDRHTYRYSPILAFILIPNILIHPCFGKILFSIVDIVVALLIRVIVKHALTEYKSYQDSIQSDIKDSDTKKSKSQRKRVRQRNKYNISKLKIDRKNQMELTVDLAMLSYLYNPLITAISTRGNCDSLAGLLVLLTLYFLQCKKCYFITGCIHGVSIHFRLFPVIYSLTFFMFLSKFSFYSTEDRRKRSKMLKAVDDKSRPRHLKYVENTIAETSSLGGHKLLPYGNMKERRTIFKKEYFLYLIPNMNQFKLMSGCLLSLSFLTCIFYYLFGEIFLYETYIYHLSRKDTRHNFSLYFYLLYLTSWVKNIGIWQKVLMVLPQLILLLVFSVRYGLNKFSLNFSVLTQTIVMVIYNSVLTSQYFVWIMAILPLCLWQIKMPVKKAMLFLSIWIIAQGVWLLPAYLLEFQGENTFLFVWIQSVSFFCANIAILGRLILYFQTVPDNFKL